jgi:ribosome-associated protein
MLDIDFFKLAVKAVKIADDKKSIDTVLLDVHDLTTITNYFVVTTAESTPQINAISGDIEKTFKTEDAVIPVRREGISSSWRVIDYGGLIIHIMSPQVRETYNLESLWREAEIIKLNDKEKSKDVVEKKSVKSKTSIVKKSKKVIKKTVNKTIKKVKIKPVKKVIKKEKRQTQIRSL